MSFEPHQDRIFAEESTSFKLVGAVLLSLALHGLMYAGYLQIKHIHWPGYEKALRLLTPKVSKVTPALLEFFRPKVQPQPPKPVQVTQKEIPIIIETQPQLSFLPVDPMQATEKEPEKPKFYSDKNSLAANQTIKKPSNDPNIEGKKRDVPFTMDVPKQVLRPEPVQNAQPRPPDKKATELKQPEPKSEPLQPQPLQPQVAEAKPKPKIVEKPGNTSLVKPEDIKSGEHSADVNDTGQSDQRVDKKEALPEIKPSRPKTLIEARARMQENRISGEKMQQEGGVQRRLEFSALDAKGTSFGAYDAAIVAAIQQCWYDLLDQSKFSGDSKGRVVVEFKLHSNGQITDLKATESTVKEFLSLLCQTAISKPAPYPKWPPEMQRLFGGEYREVRFTFYYY